MTAFSTIENAVDAMTHGAYHYVHKPFNLDDVAAIVDKALEAGSLRREVRSYRTGQGREFGFEAIIGQSPAMTAVKTLLERVAGSPGHGRAGETGTGKDCRKGDPLQRRSRRQAVRQHHLLGAP